MKTIFMVKENLLFLSKQTETGASIKAPGSVPEHYLHGIVFQNGETKI